jgi:hypothetical protein
LVQLVQLVKLGRPCEARRIAAPDNAAGVTIYTVKTKKGMGSLSFDKL